MDEILAMADLMGVSIQWEDFLPLGWAGAYWAASHVVYILRGMPRPKTRTVLAHELAHANYRHEGRSTADEWQADVWAAEQLISTAALLEAAADRPSLEGLARRLDVTPHLAEVRIRSVRGPSAFMDFQPLRLRYGLPTLPGPAARPVEPRRLTTMVPVVQAAPRVTVQPVPRVSVQAIPRELVSA